MIYRSKVINKKQLEEDYNNGLPVREIREKHGINSQNQFYKILKRLGIGTNRMYATKIIINEENDG